MMVPITEPPYDGLYAIGTDGVRLYHKVYPIQIAATRCGNNVNSGRIPSITSPRTCKRISGMNL